PIARNAPVNVDRREARNIVCASKTHAPRRLHGYGSPRTATAAGSVARRWALQKRRGKLSAEITAMRCALCVGILVVLFTPAAVASVKLQNAGVSPTGGGLFAQIGIQSTVNGQPVWPASIDVANLATLPPSTVVNFPDRASVALSRIKGISRGS